MCISVPPISSLLFCRAFIECLINPLQEQMEEWKRGANTLDKDHAKGKRIIHTIFILLIMYLFLYEIISFWSDQSNQCKTVI